MHQLRLLKDGGEVVLPMKAPLLIIGRAEDCSIQLDEPRASRWHCRIDRKGSRFILRDLESRNGTFVNGVRVVQKVLAPGDRIRIGRTEIVFEKKYGEALAAMSRKPSEARVQPESIVHRKALYILPVSLLILLCTTVAYILNSSRTVPTPNGTEEKTASIERDTSAREREEEKAPFLERGLASSKREKERGLLGKRESFQEKKIPLKEEKKEEKEAEKKEEKEESAPVPKEAPAKEPILSDAGDLPGEPGLIYDRNILASLSRKVEDLAAGRDFKAAVDLCREIIERCPGENVYSTVKDDLISRLEVLSRESEFFSEMISRVGEGIAKGEKFAAKSQGRVSAADREGVKFSRRGKRVAWKEIPLDALMELAKDLDLSPEALMGFAFFSFENGREREGNELLFRASQKGGAYSEEVQGVLSQRLGLEAPKEGFAYFRGEWMLPARKSELLFNESIAEPLAKLGDPSKPVREEAYRKLREAGWPAAERFAGELKQQKQGLVKNIVRAPEFSRLKGLLAEKKRFQDLRDKVLTLIFDEKRYPHKCEGSFKSKEEMRAYLETQQKIDELKVQMENIWNGKKNGKRASVKVSSSFMNSVIWLKEIEEQLSELDVSFTVEGEEPSLYFLTERNAFTIADFPLDREEGVLIPYNERIMEHNEKIEWAAAIEKDQVRITNQYRILMGRRALVLNKKLLSAARKHSEEMNRLGYFSHISPIKERRTVHHRVKQEGYSCNGVSENIAMGRGALGVHNSWIRSPGHHRNILADIWNEMAAGVYGLKWTQVFGSRKPAEVAADLAAVR